jgi:hypothetical protein
MEGPLWANCDDVVLFFSAYIFVIIVSNKASFEISDFSFAKSGDSSL